MSSVSGGGCSRGWLRGMAGNYPYKRRYPFARVYRTVRASSARGALRLHPYPLSPCYNTTLHWARGAILYSQPFLSLFGKVQYLDTKGFQFPHALFQCGDLMRDCDVGKVRIDDLYDLIMQAKYPAPCLISKIGFPILASEPDVHLPAYPALR